MLRTFWPASLVAVVALAIAISSCDRVTKLTRSYGLATPTPSPAPTPDNMAVARNALTLDDVLAMLEKGDSQETIIHAVQTRKITQKMVDAQELKLCAMGARRQLIKELKDSKNILTAEQELAYGRLPRRSSPKPAGR